MGLHHFLDGGGKTEQNRLFLTVILPFDTTLIFPFDTTLILPFDTTLIFPFGTSLIFPFGTILILPFDNTLILVDATHTEALLESLLRLDMRFLDYA